MSRSTIGLPFPLQSGVPGQSQVSQPTPVHPMLQVQVWEATVQIPFPEQLDPSPGQPRTSHSVPDLYTCILHFSHISNNLWNFNFIKLKLQSS
jgi:hypothetical protein